MTTRCGGHVNNPDQSGKPISAETEDEHSEDEHSEEEHRGDASTDQLLEEAAKEIPGFTQLRGLRRPINISAVMLTGLFALSSLAFLYFAQQLVLPIVLAVLLNFLFMPFVRQAHRLRIPRPVIAVVLLSGFGLAIVLGLYTLSGPASRFIADAPQRLRELENKVRQTFGSVEEFTETARRVERAATEETDAPTVAVRGPGLVETALGYAQSLGVGALAAGILLLFLLCSDEIFLHKLVRVLPTLHDKRLAVEIFRQIERDISYYLLTITLINAGLGTTAGFLLWLVGTPTPALWGVMVGAFNFVPYLGPGVAMIVLAFVGLVSFETLSMAAVPPLIVLGLNVLEANIITPLALGRRLDLNPVMIFLALAFWGFLWGIPGMALAVPLLVMLKTVCDHVEPLSPVSEFLSGSEPPPAGMEQPSGA